MVESSENAFHIYAALTIHGVPGLCFLRGNPQRLIQEYSLRPEQILLLSSRALFGFEAAEDLQEISHRVSRFLEKNRNSVILVDGLEYLASRFGFDSTYRFIQEKVYDAVEADVVLLFPADPKTFNERERALLTSELRTLQ
ncbi:MAG: DUF835 domain-containing protein [Candidatus Bathyarchaeota archaeon]|nr:DUF835 domain-containing protein [Candidatus Bathyarchaeota archaeon]